MARRPAALEQPGGPVWVVGRYSPPTFGGPLRLAHRNFDAGRPVREAQRSVVVVRWAVLDGHKPESTSGRFGAVHLSEFAGAPLRACRDFIERVRLTASLLCRNARPAHNRTAHRNPPAEALVDLGSNLALLLQGEPISLDLRIRRMADGQAAWRRRAQFRSHQTKHRVARLRHVAQPLQLVVVVGSVEAP